MSSSQQPYRIESNTTLGRFLVADRSLKAGDLLITEKALLVGPRAQTPPICLNCYQAIDYNTCRKCPSCNVAPLCLQKCTSDLLGHTQHECNAFKNSNVKDYRQILDNLQIILPMRCLLLEKADPGAWAKLILLESHLEKRRETSVWNRYQMEISKVLREFDLVPPETTDDTIQHITGIIDVNCFEVRLLPPKEPDLPYQMRNTSIRGIYLEASLLTHDCTSNTHVAMDDKFNIIIRCSTDIEKNEMLYFNYTYTLMGTFERQVFLHLGKYFECECKRCKDPTELGTYLSSILCNGCKKGYVSPMEPHFKERYAKKFSWKCADCEKKFSGKLVHTTIKLAENMLEDTDKQDYKSNEKLLTTLLRSFPPENIVILNLKQQLIETYKDIIVSPSEPSKYVLERKFTLCEDLLTTLDKIEPGISRLKGIILYEMQIPLLILSYRQYNAGQISVDQLHEKLLQVETILREAIRILLYEPRSSPEGGLLRETFEQLKDITKNISEIQKVVKLNAKTKHFPKIKRK